MKKLQFSKTADNNISKKKIFFIALGLCLVAIGVAIYVGVNATVKELNQDKTLDFTKGDDTSSAIMNSQPEPTEETEDVNQNTEDLPIDQEDDEKTEDTAAATEESEKTEAESKKSDQKETKKTVAFAKPLDGKVLTEFSGGELVKSKTLKEWRTHDGVDLAATANTPVKAIQDGKVEEITEDPMWGVCITLSHENGYQSMYYGLKPNVPVKKGSEINVGDIVGYVGNTAEIEISEESHLHLAVKKDDSWVDPMSLF